MKANNNIKMGLHKVWFHYNLLIKSLILSAFAVIAMQSTCISQEAQFTRPSWRLGLAAGANLNFYNGSTNQLSSDFTPPATFHEGKGVGLYLAPVWEFAPPESRWGFMLQAGYDSRKGKFDQVNTPCNCPADLSSDLSYISVEPSLRFAPFKSDFYLFGGPRLAFNIQKSYTYKQGINPDFPDQEVVLDKSGDFSEINNMLISMQIGAGYDIQLSSQSHETQAILSPFISFHPYYGQDPRSIETWNITTVRIGAALKFGRGDLIVVPNSVIDKVTEPKVIKAANSVIDIVTEPKVIIAAIVDPDVNFYVNSPSNVASERRVRETFPLRNYIFFELGSTEIPDRYVLLQKDQVKDFKEDQLEVFTPKRLIGRSAREMTVYYNVLNILGDRMGKNPSSTITLVGSSENGPTDGKAMAESVKHYLVEIFSIDKSRISTEGRNKPKIPSEQPGGELELKLLREGDQRVSIESSTPALLMEFQSGPNVPLKPVEIITIQEAPLESYVTFNVDGAKKAFTSWSLEITDDKGITQYYGPYTQDQVSMPGKSILGTRPEGKFSVVMIGVGKNGNEIRKETTEHMTLWTQSEREEGMRYSILYEFNDSKAIMIYDKYLTEIVTPKIPVNGKVIIHGYTDIIGDETNNRELSLARANNVKDIIEKSLVKAGRKDVKIEVYGFGEDEKLSPFENGFPEERFYNRSVIIDIIPAE